MKTWNAKPGEVDQKWYVVDAEGQTLGRLATRIATVLRGKHRPQFTPHVDTGDFVVVINTEKLKLSGNKMSEKVYYRHSRFFGSMKETTAQEMIEKKPSELIRIAVEGMLPKNRLARKQIKKLKAYAGADHPHDAQKPVKMELN